MTRDYETRRIGYANRGLTWSAGGLVRKMLAFAAAAVLLMGAVAISIVAFAVIMTGALIIGTYLWWKTRELRKQMRESTPDDNVIEGEVIGREVRDIPARDRHRR